jgi:pimeloyl-ACP methyl ester carboxylesterase
MLTRRRILLAHGWAMPESFYFALLGELGARFDVVTGFNGGELDADAIDNRIRAAVLRYSPECLLGWSLGALGVVRVAAEGHRSVESVVSISGFASFVPRPGHPPGARPRILDRMKKKLEVDARGVVNEFARATLSTQEARFLPDLMTAVAAAPIPSVGALSAGLDYLQEKHAVEAVPTLSPAVLLLHGSQDAITPIESFRWLAEALGARARLALVEGGGHSLPFTCPRDVAEHVRAFLNR